MRRSVSILLLTLYLGNLYGGLASFFAAQAQVRREIKQRIKQSVPEAELVLIAVTPETASSLRWLESHEFRYRGGMYDVVRTAVSGDTTRYFCINDVQEERLFAALDEHVRKQMQTDARRARAGSAPGAPASPEHMPGMRDFEPPETAGEPLADFRLLLPPSPIRDVPVPPPRSV